MRRIEEDGRRSATICEVSIKENDRPDHYFTRMTLFQTITSISLLTTRCTEDNQPSKEGTIIAKHLFLLDVRYSQIPAPALTSNTSGSGLGFGFLLYIHGAIGIGCVAADKGGKKRSCCT